MKSKIVAIALVLMMVVGALVLASCSACPGSGNCSYDGTDLAAMVGWVTDKEKNCAYAAVESGSSDDAETAMACAAYKAAGTTGKGDCDC